MSFDFSLNKYIIMTELNYPVRYPVLDFCSTNNEIFSYS